MSVSSPEVAAERSEKPLRIAIVGGGLAGMAAAAALAEHSSSVSPRLSIELFESRRQLGGRATSFRDSVTGEWVDHCQHVSLGCCTNLTDFCRRTGISELFRRDRTLNFFGPKGQRYEIGASGRLPAPFHLLSSFLRLGYLSLWERWRIALGLRRLARLRDQRSLHETRMEAWLKAAGQSDRAIRLFWTPVIVSALSEEASQVTVAAARKVFVDGLLRSTEAYEIQVPIVPLGELYGARLLDWFGEQGVRLHLGRAVRRVRGSAEQASELAFADGSVERFDYLVLALPWGQIGDLFEGRIQKALPFLKNLDLFEAAPITGVHLWFDRSIMNLPHAVLPGRLSQWVFARGQGSGVRGQGSGGSGQAEDSGFRVQGSDEPVDAPRREPAAVNGVLHYYQVVISASHALAGKNREEIIRQVIGELAAVWPAIEQAQLVKARVVTERSAVFSPKPGVEALRPAQTTPVPNLFLAGDWTATGWPATMEGAVRSGYLAAQALLRRLEIEKRIVAADLPAARLSRWLLRIR